MAVKTFIIPVEGGVIIKAVFQINLCGFGTGAKCPLGKGKPLGYNVLFGRDLHVADKQVMQMAFGNEQCVADFLNVC